MPPGGFSQLSACAGRPFENFLHPPLMSLLEHVHIELGLLEAIQEAAAHPGIDTMLTAVSRLGDFGFIWIALSLALALWPRTRRAGVTMLAALLLGYLVCNLTLKPLVERLRPCDLVEGMALIACPPDFSFPSGHTTSAFAAATAFALFYPRLGIPALLFAALMAFSRLYLFVHFPTDVAAGAVIGALCAWAAVRIVGLAARRISSRSEARAPDRDHGAAPPPGS